MKEQKFEELSEATKQNRPEALDDLLHRYEHEKIRRLVGDFLEAPPVGREIP